MSFFHHSKNTTEFRSSLDLGRSLNSIMRIKMSLPESLVSCYEWKPSQDLLRKCKWATSTYNMQQRKIYRLNNMLLFCYSFTMLEVTSRLSPTNECF